MDAFARAGPRTGSPKPEGNVPLFNRAFLKTVETFGAATRSHDPPPNKLGTGKLMNDTEKFPAIAEEGKDRVAAARGGDRKTVKRIFRKINESKGAKA